MADTFGSDKKPGYVTGYDEAYASPDLTNITAVKNCKPVLQYKPPVEKMECQSTAQSHFTGKFCPAASSCKPKIPKEAAI